MKKLFSSIDKLITDIPDDKGAWEKAIEILDNDDLVESIMDKMSAGKSSYGYTKDIWKDARDIEFAVHVMSSVPVYVIVAVDETGKEELSCATLLPEEDQTDLLGDTNIGIPVFIDFESAQNLLSSSEEENSGNAFVCRIPFALLVDNRIGLFDDDSAPELLILLNGDNSTIINRFEISPLMCASAFALRTSFLDDIAENIFDLNKRDDEDDDDDDEPFLPKLRILNDLPPC